MPIALLLIMKTNRGVQIVEMTMSIWLLIVLCIISQDRLPPQVICKLILLCCVCCLYSGVLCMYIYTGIVGQFTASNCNNIYSYLFAN